MAEAPCRAINASIDGPSSRMGVRVYCAAWITLLFVRGHAQQSAQSQMSSSPGRKVWRYWGNPGPFESCPGPTPAGDALNVSSFALDGGVQEHPIWLSSGTTCSCCTRKQESLFGVMLRTITGNPGRGGGVTISHQPFVGPRALQVTRDD